MKRVYLFTDYRGQFYSSTKHRGAAVDLDRLAKYFANHSISLVALPFSSIDFRTQSFKDEWVLYQSSEDPGLFYRSYIEDVVLGLHIQGAQLLPRFSQFKAHHNKHFLEILRDLHSLTDIRNLGSKRYGTYEDYLRDVSNASGDPFVLKASAGSKSTGVYLLDTEKKRMSVPKRISKTFSFQNLKYLCESLFRGTRPLSISNHRSKFVLQEYISGLRGDYRVVIYGEKYYVLYRENRSKDFRASGSMKFNFDVPLPPGLLDHVQKVFKSFDVPYMALDIGVVGDSFYVFEFQFLSFGQYTIEKSQFHYHFVNGTWEKKYEEPDLEREIAESVSRFIATH